MYCGRRCCCIRCIGSKRDGSCWIFRDFSLQNGFRFAHPMEPRCARSAATDCHLQRSQHGSQARVQVRSWSRARSAESEKRWSSWRWNVYLPSAKLFCQPCLVPAFRCRWARELKLWFTTMHFAKNSAFYLRMK